MKLHPDGRLELTGKEVGDLRHEIYLYGLLCGKEGPHGREAAGTLSAIRSRLPVPYPEDREEARTRPKPWTLKR